MLHFAIEQARYVLDGKRQYLYRNDAIFVEFIVRIFRGGGGFRSAGGVSPPGQLEYCPNNRCAEWPRSMPKASALYAESHSSLL